MCRLDEQTGPHIQYLCLACITPVLWAHFLSDFALVHRMGRPNLLSCSERNVWTPHGVTRFILLGNFNQSPIIIKVQRRRCEYGKCMNNTTINRATNAYPDLVPYNNVCCAGITQHQNCQPQKRIKRQGATSYYLHYHC